MPGSSSSTSSRNSTTMECFEVCVLLMGTVRQEDPHCPSQWRGSGCCDIDVAATQRVTVTVPAKDKEQAECVARNYCYEGESGCELESVDDVEVKCCIPCGECDDLGIELDWADVEVTEDDGPDPDERD